MSKSAEQQHTTRGWIVVITAALFFFYEFIQMNLFDAINVELRQAFNLSASQLGQLSAMYFYGIALFLFPAGNLLDRFSTKKILIFAVTLCVVATFIFGIAHEYSIAALARFLIGVAVSFCFLSCVRLASRWFPPKKMAFVVSVAVTMAMLGGLVAQTPMALLTAHLGWRNAVLIDGVLGIFILLAIILFLQDRPPNSHENVQADKAHLQDLGFLRCIKSVLLNPQNWLGGLYTSLMNAPVFVIGALWGMQHLMSVHHLSSVEASYVVDMLFVGVIIGSPTFGWFSDRIGRRVLPMIVGATLSIIVVLMLLYLPVLSFSELMLLVFCLGFFTSSQVLTYPVLAELNPIALTGTAISVASVLIMSSGFILQPLFGWLLELNWDHTTVNNVAVYSPHDFMTAMLMLPLGFVLALVISFFIKETYCQAVVPAKVDFKKKLSTKNSLAEAQA